MADATHVAEEGDWRALIGWRNTGFPLLAGLFLLALASRHYLLFHTYAELFSIVVGVTLTAVAWYSYRFSQNHLLMFLGCGFFWVSLLDLTHTLSYYGMPDTFGASADRATQFWIATRYFEALLLLAAPGFLARPLRRVPWLLGFGGLAGLLAAAIYGGLFPACFVEGQGLTPFKVVSEYLIVGLLAAAWWRFYQIRGELRGGLYHFLAAALLLAILGGLAFTHYTDVYGLTNLAGHLFKFFSFWMLFLAVVRAPLEALLISAERSQENERQLRIYEQVVSATQDFMAFVDSDYVYRMVNRAYERNYGIGRKGLVGRNVADLLGPGIFAERVKPKLDRALAGEEVHYQDWFSFPARGRLFLDVAYYPYRGEEGAVAGVVVSVRDMSAMKRVQDELALARDQAEAANRAKGAFLASMSHELRTPLNAIMGYAQLLESNAALPSQQQQQARIIHRSGDYLLMLINDLLDLAKIESGRFQLNLGYANLKGLLRGVLHLFEEQARRKGIALRFEPAAALDALVEVDERRLRQILSNLLANAIKFTEQGAVTLRAVLKERLLELEVEDSGVGIPEAEREVIFEPFRQVGDERFRAQGSGLGLAITRRLVEQMRGAIVVESALGQGSRFRVTLPIRRAVPDQSAAAPVVGYRRLQGEGPLRILVADDIESYRDILAQWLIPLGFEVRQAEDGEACLAEARQWRPDLILLDLRMPKMDGLAAACALRAQTGLDGLPIVAISAYNFIGDRQAAVEAGCNGYLAKPVQREALLEVLETLLPLRWEYGAPPAAAAPPGLDIPEALRQELRQILRRGDLKRLQLRLEQLAAGPDAAPALARLRDLAHNFHLRELQALLGEG